MNKKVLFITEGAIIAALYVILTYVSNAFGLASGVIQVRISEALIILAIYNKAVIPGVTVGCFLANFLTGCVWVDILCGSAATFIGAVGAYALKKHKYLAPLPNVLSNAIIVPFVLIFAYGVSDAYWYCFLTVGAGEVISGVILGIILLLAGGKPLKKILTDPEVQ